MARTGAREGLASALRAGGKTPAGSIADYDEWNMAQETKKNPEKASHDLRTETPSGGKKTERGESANVSS